MLAPGRQSGFAFMLTLMLLVVGGASAYFTFAKSSSPRIAQDRLSAAAMAAAKDALIGYAAAHPTRPGALPCPDTTNDGVSDPDGAGACVVPAIGRLPYVTLGVEPLRDGSGELLWYAVSTNFADTATSTPLNSDSIGQFAITGATPMTGVVAIIFAPRQAVVDQIRNAAAGLLAANFLEGQNADGTTSFEAGITTSTFNDNLLPITNDALFQVVGMRVAKEVLLVLQNYRVANGYLPRPNDYADATGSCSPALTQGRLPLDPATCPSQSAPASVPMAGWVNLPAWYAANQWQRLTYYAVSEGCSMAVTSAPAVAARAAACATLDLTALGALSGGGPEAPLIAPLGPSATTPALAVALVSGRAVGAQLHPCTTPTACFQDTADASNVDGDKNFARPPRLPASNDKIGALCPAGSACQLTNCPAAPGLPCTFAQ